MNNFKQQAAEAALSYLEDYSIIGVGTGSTVNCFIEQLARMKHRLDACVPSSLSTENRLRAAGIPIIELNAVSELPIYIDGADEVNSQRQMIKGGGGALTREKIIATAAKKFICIVDESKVVNKVGTFPVAVEVLPIARSLAARELVKLGGDPVYRQSFITDNGNIILDVYNFEIISVRALEEAIKLIPGVVESGLFGKRLADMVLSAGSSGITVF